MVAPEFKAPALTSRAQKAAEELAERRDYWIAAHALLKGKEWLTDLHPAHVLDLARFLASEDS